MVATKRIETGGIAAREQSGAVLRMRARRVALVSPFWWTFRGGVPRHIEALASELIAAGHDVRVFAPFDRDRRRAALLHRGTRPQQREAPEWLVPLGGTIGWPPNGAVSKLPGTPPPISPMRPEPRGVDPAVVPLA